MQTPFCICMCNVQYDVSTNELSKTGLIYFVIMNKNKTTTFPFLYMITMQVKHTSILIKFLRNKWFFIKGFLLNK